MTLALDIENLTLRRGGNLILGSISLEIQNGDFVGVLGTNGAGKTTLFKAILGLVTPESGRIKLFGEDIRRGNAHIGYLPQARNLASHIRLSCHDYLHSAWNGQTWGFHLNGRTAADRAIAHALHLTGSTALAKRPINELSGGERQRILIAQSLMGAPKLLILDEPLISLDPARQHDVIRLVRQIQQELKLTVLFSAHELNPLLGVLDRVLYLGHGKAALGTVDEVVTGPVLSKLYNTDIDVIRVNNRIVVMSGNSDLEQDAHLHEHEGEHHSHSHGHSHG